MGTTTLESGLRNREVDGNVSRIICVRKWVKTERESQIEIRGVILRVNGRKAFRKRSRELWSGRESGDHLTKKKKWSKGTCSRKPDSTRRLSPAKNAKRPNTHGRSSGKKRGKVKVRAR